MPEAAGGTALGCSGIWAASSAWRRRARVLARSSSSGKTGAAGEKPEEKPGRNGKTRENPMENPGKNRENSMNPWCHRTWDENPKWRILSKGGRSTTNWIKKPSNTIFETHQVITSTIKTHGFDSIYILLKKTWVSPCVLVSQTKEFYSDMWVCPWYSEIPFFGLANHFVFPQGISKPGCDVGMAQNYDHPRMDALIYFDLVC